MATPIPPRKSTSLTDATEEEGPEAVLPEMPVEPTVKGQILPWRGRGNIVAAVGVALLDLAKVR